MDSSKLFIVAYPLAVNRREANIVLLNDGGIQTLEIEQQNVLVVQPLLWLQDETSFISRLFLLIKSFAMIID